MVDVIQKKKPEQQVQTPGPAPTIDMASVVAAINDQTAALIGAVMAIDESKPQPCNKWIFTIVRDGAGDLKQVVAERQ